MHRGLDEFFRALESDRAMTVRQARSLYRISAKQAMDAGAVMTRKSVKTTAYSNEMQKMRFLALEDHIANYSGPRLRHLAGVVSMRNHLGLDPDVWQSEAAAPLATFEPDALWESPHGVAAIEYDAGSYSRETVMNKGEAFAQYAGGQIWGVASEKRVAFVERALRGVGVTNAQVFYAPWHL